MTRIEEIETRLAAIPAELDKDGADLDALKAEVVSLKAERQQLMDAAEKRQQILDDVRTGGGTVVRKMSEGKEARSFAPDTEEYRTAWLKHLQGKELDAEERAAVTATAAIPTQTMNRIISAMDLVPMISAIDVTYIPGNVTWPKEKTVNAAAWVEMATAATDSSDALEAISLGAYKLIKTVEITADVQAMAIPAFESWLVERLANKISYAIDAAIFTGTGTNQATGLLKSGELTEAGTWTAAGMTYADLLAILAALPTKYHPNATLVTTRAVFFGQILGMMTDGGDKVVVADAQSPAKFNVLGYPVIVDDNCAADTILFGDLKEAYKFNFAQAPTVESDRSVGFRSGSTVWRAMALCDGKPANKEAVVLFKKGV